MANGHVEIHDPFTNNNLASSGTDPTSQTTDMDTTIEFRLLMVYNQRRHPGRVPEVEGQGQAEPPSPKTSEIDMEVKLRGKEEKKKKRKRRGMKGVFGMCSCMRPQIKTGLSDSEEPNFRSGSFTVGEFLKQKPHFRGAWMASPFFFCPILSCLVETHFLAFQMSPMRKRMIWTKQRAN